MPFPSLAEVPTAVDLKTTVFVRCRPQLCYNVRFIGEFQTKTFTAESIGLCLHSALRLVSDVGVLRAKR